MSGPGQDLHEADAVASGRLLWIGLGLGVVIAGVALLVYAFSRGLLAGLPHDAVRLPTELPLQQHPRADLAALRHRDGELLADYAWLDRDAGIARIPIGRAMAIMAAQDRRPADDAATPATTPGQDASEPRRAETAR